MQVRILTTALPIPPCNCTNRTMYSFCMQSKHKTCTGNQSKNKNIFYSPLQSEKTNEHVGMFLNGSFDQHALSCITLNLQCSNLWGPSRSSRQKIDKVCSIDLQYRTIKSAVQSYKVCRQYNYKICSTTYKVCSTTFKVCSLSY